MDAGADAYNVAVGANAGQAMTTGVDNTIVGGTAGDAMTTGFSNTYVGRNSGGATTIGNSNVAIGDNALYTNVAADSYRSKCFIHYDISNY